MAKSQFNKEQTKKLQDKTVRLYILTNPNVVERDEKKVVTNLVGIGSKHKMYGQKYIVTEYRDQHDDKDKFIGIGVYGIRVKDFTNILNQSLNNNGKPISGTNKSIK